MAIHLRQLVYSYNQSKDRVCDIVNNTSFCFRHAKLVLGGYSPMEHWKVEFKYTDCVATTIPENAVAVRPDIGPGEVTTFISNQARLLKLSLVYKVMCSVRVSFYAENSPQANQPPLVGPLNSAWFDDRLATKSDVEENVCFAIIPRMITKSSDGIFGYFIIKGSEKFVNSSFLDPIHSTITMKCKPNSVAVRHLYTNGHQPRTFLRRRTPRAPRRTYPRPTKLRSLSRRKPATSPPPQNSRRPKEFPTSLAGSGPCPGRRCRFRLSCCCLLTVYRQRLSRRGLCAAGARGCCTTAYCMRTSSISPPGRRCSRLRLQI